MAEKKNNTTLLIIGGVVVVGAAAFFIIRSMNKKKSQAKEDYIISVPERERDEDLPPVRTDDKSEKEKTKQALIAAGVTLATLGIGEIVRRREAKKAKTLSGATGMAKFGKSGLA